MRSLTAHFTLYMRIRFKAAGLTDILLKARTVFAKIVPTSGQLRPVTAKLFRKCRCESANATQML